MGKAQASYMPTSSAHVSALLDEYYETRSQLHSFVSRLLRWIACHIFAPGKPQDNMVVTMLRLPPAKYSLTFVLQAASV